jgi:hypothetical protein
MADAPYLVALALVELNGKRSLPIAGRSQSAAAAHHGDPGQEGLGLALELLLRLWQRSDEGPLQRAAGETSLLLVEIPLAEMTETLPALKARWLADGNTEVFQAGLQALAQRGWRVLFAKYEPVTLVAWP